MKDILQNNWPVLFKIVSVIKKKKVTELLQSKGRKRNKNDVTMKDSIGIIVKI